MGQELVMKIMISKLSQVFQLTRIITIFYVSRLVPNKMT